MLFISLLFLLLMGFTHLLRSVPVLFYKVAMSITKR